MEFFQVIVTGCQFLLWKIWYLLILFFFLVVIPAFVGYLLVWISQVVTGNTDSWGEPLPKSRCNRASRPAMYAAVLLWVLCLIPYLDLYLGTHIDHTTRNGLSQSYSEYEKKKSLQERQDTGRITRTNLPVEVRRFEIVKINPPKHLYVSLEDVQNHYVYTSVYVSKHCNNLQAKIGEEYNLKVQPYKLSNDPSSIHIEFVGLYKAFCE